MPQLCDLQIHINNQHTFFINKDVLSTYSGKFKKMMKQARRAKNSSNTFKLDNFPGGPYGFESVTGFCYNNGEITITVSNVCLLHCCAVFLDMSENESVSNLLEKTETFLESISFWSLKDLISSLKSCEKFFAYADATGLVEKLVFAILVKIARNSDMNNSSSSSSSSPETLSRVFRLSSSSSFRNTAESSKPSPRLNKEWWFEEMTVLSAKTIEKIIMCSEDNNSLILTRFLLHYLKTKIQTKQKNSYIVLAESAVFGVILAGKPAFSCRKLFWVLRVLSGFNLSQDSMSGLENLIGELLDQATLDDLLISGAEKGSIYDVDMVIRLLNVFVNGVPKSAQQMMIVGRLVDKYMSEISPDQNLKVSKFLAVAETLPDLARDCFDGVYRAIDTYLESHPKMSLEARSRLCRCLNYKKLSLEACKELAKNPKIPPNIAVEAMKSQPTTDDHHQKSSCVVLYKSPTQTNKRSHHKKTMTTTTTTLDVVEKEEEIEVNLQKRVNELENLCREMKGQMSKLLRHKNSNVIKSSNYSTMPRLC